jgi:hypothetical protein
VQYAELGGTQDGEVRKLASQLIPGYPPMPTVGSAAYINALSQLDGDMPQCIQDNTDDELTHHQFINAYLASKGAEPSTWTNSALYRAARLPAPISSGG